MYQLYQQGNNIKYVHSGLPVSSSNNPQFHGVLSGMLLSQVIIFQGSASLSFPLSSFLQYTSDQLLFSRKDVLFLSFAPVIKLTQLSILLCCYIVISDKINSYYMISVIPFIRLQFLLLYFSFPKRITKPVYYSLFHNIVKSLHCHQMASIGH